jgi:pimeloyl-ACP methyl ester carboxylesterase
VSAIVAAAAILLAGSSSGCGFGRQLAAAVRSPTPPMRVLPRIRYGPDSADGVVIFLPGFGAPVSRFERWGFVEAIREHTRYDVLLADAHFGFYRTLTLVPRLRDDVVAWAQAAGYREIWLVGASMGGLGALVYASERSEDLAGVIVLGPFLGPSALVQEIAEAGGLPHWVPSLERADGPVERAMRSAWDWVRNGASTPGRPPVFLVFGTGDPSVRAHRLLARALPPTHVICGAGGHKWHVWQPMFERLVARTLSPSGTGPRAETHRCHVDRATTAHVPGGSRAP